MRMRLSIQDFVRKINSYLLYLFPISWIALFALCSLLFLLYTLVILTVSAPERHAFVLTKGQGVKKEEIATRLPYVASKTGKKYYESLCSAVKRIKEKNRVYFASEEEAKASGREKSAQCE